MRRVSSSWNEFLLSSPRYWQAIHIASPPQVITAALERSGPAPLCVYCFGSSPMEQPNDLPKELQASCARVRTLRSENSLIYSLFRWFLRDHRPALQTLQLARYSATMEDTVEPLGDLSSIRYLTAKWWQPSPDAAWLAGLREQVLFRTNGLDMELLQLLSACANLEDLTITDEGHGSIQDFPGATLPITLPRLKSIRMYFKTNSSAMKLTPKLITPQCHQRFLGIDRSPSPHEVVGRYGRFISPEESCTQHPKSACLFIQGEYIRTRFEYETESCLVDFLFVDASVETAAAFHDLVQEYQRLLKGPSLTVTVRYPSEHVWWFLKSLHDQNIQTIVARFAKQKLQAVGDLLNAIGARSVDITPRPMADTTTDWPFKSLRSIEIHDADMHLGDFTKLVEE